MSTVLQTRVLALLESHHSAAYETIKAELGADPEVEKLLKKNSRAIINVLRGLSSPGKHGGWPQALKTGDDWWAMGVYPMNRVRKLLEEAGSEWVAVDAIVRSLQDSEYAGFERWLKPAYVDLVTNLVKALESKSVIEFDPGSSQVRLVGYEAAETGDEATNEDEEPLQGGWQRPEELESSTQVEPPPPGPWMVGSAPASKPVPAFVDLALDMVESLRGGPLTWDEILEAVEHQTSRIDNAGEALGIAVALLNRLGAMEVADVKISSWRLSDWFAAGAEADEQWNTEALAEAVMSTLMSGSLDDSSLLDRVRGVDPGADLDRLQAALLRLVLQKRLSARIEGEAILVRLPTESDSLVLEDWQAGTIAQMVEWLASNLMVGFQQLSSEIATLYSVEQNQVWQFARKVAGELVISGGAEFLEGRHAIRLTKRTQGVSGDESQIRRPVIVYRVDQPMMIVPQDMRSIGRIALGDQINEIWLFTSGGEE